MIVQAPIGGASCPELAAAVSNAGGLGGIALTWLAPAQAEADLVQVRSLTTKPFYVNFALAFTPHSLDIALENGVPIITFSFGDARPWIERCHSRGVQVGVQVGCLVEAEEARGAGADFLVAQGIEAGGHVQGQSERASLLREVLAVGLPVWSAGGIATRGDVAGVLAEGAVAAVVGTRFLTAHESRAHDDYKDRVVAAGDGDTVLTSCFSVGWPNCPHRVLRNSTWRDWEAAGCPREAPPTEVARTASGAVVTVREDTQPLQGATGNLEAMAMYAGTSSARITRREPAAAIVADLLP